MSAKKDKRTYQELTARLDEIMAAMQANDITVQAATALYKEGDEILRALEQQLSVAENDVTKLGVEL